MSLRHSILQENSQPRHMHCSTYDRKIWLLMTPSSLDGLTATYIYTPAEETIDILRIDDSIRVITKFNIPTFSISKEPGLGYETYGIGAQCIRISIFGLSVAATNTFRWTWDSSWLLLSCWPPDPVGCAQPNSDPVQYVAWSAVPLWDPAVYPILWFLS